MLQFEADNTATIVAQFISDKAKASYVVGGSATTLTQLVNQAFADLDTKYKAGNYAAIAGAAGINLVSTNQVAPPLFNGVGTPVTDTVGLQ